MSKLSQMRNASDKLIEIDSDFGIITRTGKVDNGRGEPIPSDETSEHKIICRVSYQSAGVWSGKQWEGGLTIDVTPYLLARFDADLEQGDKLEWRGRKYTLGVVTRPEIDGGYICIQAPLTEVK